MNENEMNHTGAILYLGDWPVFTRRVAAIVLLGATIYAATLITPVLQLVLLSFILAFTLVFLYQSLGFAFIIGYGQKITDLRYTV